MCSLDEFGCSLLSKFRFWEIVSLCKIGLGSVAGDVLWGGRGWRGDGSMGQIARDDNAKKVVETDYKYGWFSFLFSIVYMNISREFFFKSENLQGSWLPLCRIWDQQRCFGEFILQSWVSAYDDGGDGDDRRWLEVKERTTRFLEALSSLTFPPSSGQWWLMIIVILCLWFTIEEVKSEIMMWQKHSGEFPESGEDGACDESDIWSADHYRLASSYYLSLSSSS